MAPFSIEIFPCFKDSYSSHSNLLHQNRSRYTGERSFFWPGIP